MRNLTFTDCSFLSHSFSLPAWAFIHHTVKTDLGMADFVCLCAAQAHERMMSPTGPSPNPNIPSEYCSTIPPMQQARAAGTLNSPPPTVMVPVSVLKHPGNDGTHCTLSQSYNSYGYKTQWLPLNIISSWMKEWLRPKFACTTYHIVC